MILFGQCKNDLHNFTSNNVVINALICYFVSCFNVSPDHQEFGFQKYFEESWCNLIASSSWWPRTFRHQNENKKSQIISSRYVHDWYDVQVASIFWCLLNLMAEREECLSRQRRCWWLCKLTMFVYCCNSCLSIVVLQNVYTVQSH